MTPHLFLVEIIPKRLCQRMPADASCVCIVRFGQSVPDAGILCDVAIGEAYIRILLFQLLVKSPSHDTHEHSIPKYHPAPNHFRKFYYSFVISFVTGFTERNQVVRSVTARLSAFDVMHIEYLVFGFSFATLASMPVAEQDIFTHVPETELFPLLVFSSHDIRIFDFLDIERCNFYDNFRNRKYLMYPSDNGEMRIYLILYRWGKPSLATLTILKSRFPVSCLAITPGSAVLSARRK